jgi:hypothetical protein
MPRCAGWKGSPVGLGNSSTVVRPTDRSMTRNRYLLSPHRKCRAQKTRPAYQTDIKLRLDAIGTQAARRFFNKDQYPS